MKSYFMPVLVSTCLLMAWTTTKAQPQTLIGIDGIVESSDATLHPGIGVVVERRFTKHSGFEGGIFYKVYNERGTALITTSMLTYTLPLRVSEQYLSIPLLYKYYTRLLNISAGPTFDYYTGFTQKDKSPSFTINDYNLNPNLSVGFLIKISKSFHLKKQLQLEPELRLNPNFSYERPLAGVGVAVKYLLH